MNKLHPRAIPGAILLLLVLSLGCSAPVALTATPAPALGLAVELVAPTAISTAQTEELAGVVYIEPDCVWMLAIGDVNVRAAPSAEAAILATLLEGQGLEVFAIVDGWAQVKDGYVKAEWLIYDP